MTSTPRLPARPRPPTRFLVTVGFALASGLCADLSRAEMPPNVDAETKSAARALTEEGLSLFDSGNFAGAVDKLSRADDLVRLPTTGLALARAYVQVGKLVEASEKLLAVTRITLDTSASPAQRKALDAAERERKELAARIAMLEVALEPDVPTATVTIDGKPLARALLGAKRPTNPGERLIEVTTSGGVVARKILLVEGGTERIVVTPAPIPVLPSNPTTAESAPTTTAPTSAVTTPPNASVAGPRPTPRLLPTRPPSPSPEAPRSSTMTVLGGVFLGIGGAGLATSAALGILTMNSVSELEACTPDPTCTLEDQLDILDRATKQQTGTFLALGLGAAVAATGAIVLVLRPSSTSTTSTTASLLVGPASAGLKLSF
jgi:hypothetical protein